MDISTDAVRRELREINSEHEASLAPTAELIDRLYQTEADEQTKFDMLVGGANRNKYLKVGGVAILTTAFLAACGSNDSATTPTSDTTAAGGASTTAASSADPGDVKALQFAASLENLAVAAYTKGAPLIKTPANLAIATTFLGHHKEHAGLFNGAIKSFGGKEVTEPNAKYLADFTPMLEALKTEADVLKFALTVETAAASTYFAQQGNLKGEKLGYTLMTVGATEFRHAALLSAALKMPIASTMKGFLTEKEALPPA
jgi:hypothetical protein